MDDPKIFEENFLASTLPNSPIRKVITLKVKFEDLQKISPYQVITAGDLENFSKFFEKVEEVKQVEEVNQVEQE